MCVIGSLNCNQNDKLYVIMTIPFSQCTDNASIICEKGYIQGDCILKRFMLLFIPCFRTLCCFTIPTSCCIFYYLFTSIFCLANEVRHDRTSYESLLTGSRPPQLMSILPLVYGQLTQVLHLQNHLRITDLGICSSMSMPSLHIESTGSTKSQDITTHLRHIKNLL